MKRRRVISGLAGLTATGLAGCTGTFDGRLVSESFSDSYAVTGETRVLISNQNGPVSVQPSDSEELTIAGEKQADSNEGLDSITIDVVEGDRFVINVRFSTGSSFSNRRVNLTVGIPEGVIVDTANTANGDVSVTDVSGDLNAATVNGNVEITGVSGFVRGETTNGTVRIRNCTGIAGARTSNGSVDVELLAMRDDLTCSTSNGNVTVRVGSDVSAAIRLSTNAGNARIRDVPVTTEIDRRGYITGSLRGGSSPLLSLESNNGDVTLQAV